MATSKEKADAAPALKSYVDTSSNVTMEELLSGTTKSSFVPDTIVHGIIVEKRQDVALLDIGYKAEGEIPRAEFGADWETVKVGDELDVLLEETENEQNMPGISLQKAKFIKAWDKITSEYGEGSTIRGLMKHRVKGGIIIDLNGVEAFLPGSQIDIVPVKNMDDYIGKEFDLKILKINKDRKNIVVSRRELLAESREDMRAKLLQEMQVGELRKGTVKNITDFGAFIDLNGVDGLLHITDMSWARITNPREMLDVGQEVEVMILDIDHEKKRVSLGLKQKTRNPWDNVDEKFPVGSHVTGRVVNIMPYGAFVEIEEGVEGLIHVSEMSWTKRVTKPGDVVQVGEEVEAVVLDVNKQDKKISLGLRQKTRNPWEVLAEKYPAGSKIKGKVRNMTSYGAFVEIENDIDGMIHVTDMSWTRKINNPNEVLKVGDEVEVIILDIDPQQQRISLGLKQAENDPWENIEQLYKIGDVVKGKVTKIIPFGAFVELSHKIDGLVHISQISKDRIDKVKDKLQLGQEIEAMVIKLDKNVRRIGLSIKALEEGFNEEDLKAADEEVTAAMLKPGEALGTMGALIGNSLDGLDVMKEAREEEEKKSE